MPYDGGVEHNSNTMSDRELIVVKRQSSKAVEAANALVVESAESYAEATTLLGKIKTALALVKEETEKVTRPLLDALNAERARWKPLMQGCEDAEKTVKMKMLAWYNQEQERARAEAAKIEAKVASGKMSVEKGMEKAEAIVQPDRATAANGIVSEVRKVRKVYIVDPMKVPREYLVVNEVMVRKDALAGKEIPGVEVRTENTIAGMIV